MPKFIQNILLSVSLISLSAFTHASLITNGSFEQLTFANTTTSTGLVSHIDLQAFKNKTSAWDVFSTLPGWKTS
ncbi:MULTISPECIES: hypothetical protein [unclassified Colwellia]|uniref:hypothetical protein n=1 Tax=unclassified Colwellia TaxID=196834 RepID=UPI0015F64934|nr:MULTISPECIES: hypothetical protein [unclassified Colwellia]MBA6231640.1 hypothetical protein [Colwellia sp. MB02u-7]MBA6235504.1 hypothetical protein [Colwellia sp. MB02u-11]MBA6258058.1 hypothetical protein [Colwellia sp. MB3u-28]MBA6259752.1 hypothetical protein [Colwellia sp. MB3u-41]MBA6299836.1 hypothetical protein [Colwellia sp. MB3u-22]